MKPRPKIVCLCGSTRFMHAYTEANEAETLAGNIVLTVGNNPIRMMREAVENVASLMTKDVKAALDELHLHKILMSNEVLFLNVGGYIGDSTARELAFALYIGKPVRFIEPEAGQLFITGNGPRIAQLVRELIHAGW